MKKTIVVSILAFMLCLCAGLAQAESTDLIIEIRNNTSEPLSFNLSGAKHANGHLMPGQRTGIKDSETAYFLKTESYSYHLTLTYAYDKGASTWIKLGNTVDLRGTRITALSASDSHNSVPWWDVQVSGGVGGGKYGIGDKHGHIIFTVNENR